MREAGRAVDIAFGLVRRRVNAAMKIGERALSNQRAPDSEVDALEAEEENSSVGAIIPTPAAIFEEVVGYVWTLAFSHSRGV